MKANAPEKIWLDSRSVFLNKPNKSGLTEYTRTDAFIEKACEWLSEHFYDGCYQFYDNDGMWIDADSMIEDFKNYMKGE